MLQAFQVPKSEVARFNKDHPPPEAAPAGSRDEEAAGKQPAAKRARTGGARDAATTGLRGGSKAGGGLKQEDESLGMEGEEGERGTGRGTPEGDGEGDISATMDAVASPYEDAITEYERQRAEQIARNRERMMALQLPTLAAELAPAKAPPKPVAIKPKGELDQAGVKCPL